MNILYVVFFSNIFLCLCFSYLFCYLHRIYYNAFGNLYAKSNWKIPRRLEVYMFFFHSHLISEQYTVSQSMEKEFKIQPFVCVCVWMPVNRWTQLSRWEHLSVCLIGGLGLNLNVDHTPHQKHTKRLKECEISKQKLNPKVKRFFVFCME